MINLKSYKNFLLKNFQPLFPGLLFGFGEIAIPSFSLLAELVDLLKKIETKKQK